MNKIIYTLKAMSLSAVLFWAGNAGAATYTAVASGNWSDAATWGGTAPGSTVSNDNIIIPAGFTVTLDNEVEFGGLLNSIDVNGTLSGEHELRITSGSLTGNGTLTLTELEISGLSALTFTGDLDVDVLRTDLAFNLNLEAVVDVQDSLVLEGGTLTIVGGSTFTLANEAVIKVDGGSLVVDGGAVTPDGDYDVLYVGGSVTSGAETSFTGFNNLMVDLEDDEAVLSLGEDVTVEGDIEQMSGIIALNGNKLVINGDYDNTSTVGLRGSATSVLEINSDAVWTSDLRFETGAQQLDSMLLNIAGGTDLNLVSDLTIVGQLELQHGNLNLVDGAELIAGAGADMRINQGAITIDNGTFNGTASYNVIYVGTASETALEMTGSGLNDVTLDLDAASGTVALDEAYTISGDLHLISGTLNLAGNDLTLQGDIETTSEGWLMADNTADLTIDAPVSLTDTLNFSAAGGNLFALNIDIASGGTVMIGSDLKVNELNFTNGSIIMLDRSLELASDGTMSGIDENSYVMLEEGGSFVATVPSGGNFVWFPVGTTDDYSPAMIQLNSGTTSKFEVNVMEGVWSNGTSGMDLSDGTPVVDRTWNISSDAGSSTNMDLKLQWSGNMEVNSFDRNNAYIAHYLNNMWDVETSSSAMTTSDGMYELTREAITSLSPFAITETGSELKIEENSIIAGIYPNPVNDQLTINLKEAGTQVELLDAYGKLVSTTTTGGNSLQLDFTGMPAGYYFVRATSGSAISTQKIVKQ